MQISTRIGVVQAISRPSSSCAALHLNRVAPACKARSKASRTAGAADPAGPPGAAGPKGPGPPPAARVSTGADTVVCPDGEILAEFVCPSGPTDGAECAMPGTAATELVRLVGQGGKRNTAVAFVLGNLPNAGQHQRFAVLAAEVIRLLASFIPRFIEPLARNNAAPFLEMLAELSLAHAVRTNIT